MFAFVAVAAQPLSATTIALEWSPSGSTGISRFTRGWAFETSMPLTITHLGWYDAELNGLAQSHPVGIWNDGGTLLISGTVAAGTTDPLDGRFRYTDELAGNQILPAGSYVIGGLSTSKDPGIRLIPLANLTAAAGITFLGDRTNSTKNLFSFPSESQDLRGGYFGPNFKADTVSFVSEPPTPGVPEPTPAALSLLALAALATPRRRRCG
jgi:MYXO-CTERM domain-containing protein